MRKPNFAFITTLLLTALTAALCLASQPNFSQRISGTTHNPTTQQQPMQPEDRSPSSVNSFSGKIIRSGNRFVLAASDNTTYQLDDQQKAQDFFNKSVKVTGSLDASRGTIRVRAIDPT